MPFARFRRTRPWIAPTTPRLYWPSTLFVIAALCWLPVFWMQIRLRDPARITASRRQPLPLH
ncbi:hypothetical protein CXF96_09060 [Stenotrophomonas sp. Betaine-02u-21]|uniref:DUF2269 family protein n=1 Tax=unclassified Stenotrophomonas TaxID=196198 RepID=UPI000C32A4E5|nr:hypothetical protein CXF90_18145 [Stenotrophomonas sp. Betaine-02u-23]PKH74208.1 hypothetical protein CXF96_09060 [Stenotrophomonas sp. Betaine-02u-21]PKH94621.1 hypothetical protein CXG43_16820 [Stenotrophomonas sp. Bg11-02]